MTADLAIGALQQARKREPLPRGLVLHSDRGGQYVDSDFRQLLMDNGWQQGMSRAGETYDNRTRRLSALGYLSPEEFERAFFQRRTEGKPSLLTRNERDYS